MAWIDTVPEGEASGELSGVKRLGKVVIRPGVQARNHIPSRRSCRQHEHWNRANLRVRAQLVKKLVAIHHRHHDIAYHEIRGRRARDAQSFVTVACFENAVGRSQAAVQKRSQLLVVIDDENGAGGSHTFCQV